MATHLKVVQNDMLKGKSQETYEELAYLMSFNQGITQAIARYMQALSEFVFINMANVTLLRHDNYLDLLKSGVKFDRVAALQIAPLYMTSLFLDSRIARAEDTISHHDDKHHSSDSRKKSDWYHPYQQVGKHEPEGGKKFVIPAWKQLSHLGQSKRGRGKASQLFSNWPRVTLHINDNYCVPKWDYVERAGQAESFQTLYLETLDQTTRQSCHTINVETSNQTAKQSCET